MYLIPPNGVFADSWDYAQLIVENIRDKDGLRVPDGSFLVFERACNVQHHYDGGLRNLISPYNDVSPYRALSYDGTRVAQKIDGGVTKII